MRRPLAALAAIVVVIAATLTACSKDEADIVAKAFERPIHSAVFDLRVEVRDEGASTPAVTAALTGPADNLDSGGLPSFDWRVRTSDDTGGRFDGRLISTGRNIFVRYRGTTYEAGEDLVAQLVHFETEDGVPESLADLRRLGLDFESWFKDTSARRDAQVDGEPTARVTGQIDVSAALADLQEAAVKLPGLGGLHGIAGEDVDQLISDARFALDAGRDDGKLRRLAVTMPLSHQGLGGDTGGVVRVVLTLHEVDRPVTIQAPSSGRPITDLLPKIAAPASSQSAGP
jgi:hypothetical protein